MNQEQKNTIKQLCEAINKNAKAKGFWEDNFNVAEKLMLVCCEVAEAVEADREGRRCNDALSFISDEDDDENFIFNFKGRVKDTFEDELADAIIRLLDLSYQMKIDIARHIELKMRYNSTRPYKHGKKY